MSDLQYKHGQEKDGKTFWVGGDGLGRWVTPNLFVTLEHMIQQSRDYTESVNARLANDLWGVATEVQLFVEKTRQDIASLSVDEITRILREGSKIRR